MAERVVRLKNSGWLLTEPWDRRMLVQGCPGVHPARQPLLAFRRGVWTPLTANATRSKVSYFPVPVVVVGGNPVLAALATLSAVRQGKRVLLSASDNADSDAWPYGLLRSPELTALLNRLIGQGNYLHRQKDAVPLSGLPETISADMGDGGLNWLEPFYEYVGAHLPAGMISRLDARYRLQHARESEQEVLLSVLPQPAEKSRQAGGATETISEAFERANRCWQGLVQKLPRMLPEPDLYRESFIVTPEVILTSRQADCCNGSVVEGKGSSAEEAVQRIVYDCPHIHGFGSASGLPIDRQDALRLVLSELMQLGRGVELAGEASSATGTGT
jgi:hypothetical protein